jgi:hypothetical protein
MRTLRTYYVLIIIFLTSGIWSTTRAAGWTASVWDMDNTWGDEITTNLYAICVTDVITRTSTTNYIPAVELNVSDYVGEMGIVQSNSTSTHKNIYYRDVHPLKWWIQSQTTNYSHSQTNSFVYEGETNYVTTTLNRNGAGCYKNFKLDIADRRAYEAYMAVSERVDETAKSNFWADTPFYYKGDKEELLNGLKSKVLEIYSDFVDLYFEVTSGVEIATVSNYYDKIESITTNVTYGCVSTNYYIGHMPQYEDIFELSEISQIPSICVPKKLFELQLQLQLQIVLALEFDFQNFSNFFNLCSKIAI